VISDQDLRHHVYSATVELGRPPHSSEVASALGRPSSEVLEGFQRLRDRRLLYLGRDTGEIVMAPPFSATPTPFLVRAKRRSYFANCVWDAYGIPAALREDAAIEASCGCCGRSMALAVDHGHAVATPGIAHFAVPPSQWWDDLPYT
jgi:hypothetical protein